MSMEPSNPIINIGELAKPATVLIEKVSDAVGCLYEPTKIRRIATAEAEAARIRAESEIQITDLERRAAQRWLKEEAKHQKNMEDVTAKAIPLLNEDADPDAMEDDWIANLFAKLRHVSDSEMQDLWARVLAGEASFAGSFSKRTVNLLTDLERSDAELFTNLCRFVWRIGKEVIPLVLHAEGDIYKRYGIDFDALSHLDSIGLVRFRSSGFGHIVDSYECIALYYGKPLLLKVPEVTYRQIDTGTTIFTKSGKELAQICSSEPVDGFLEYVRGNWLYYLQRVEDSEQKELEREYVSFGG